MNWLRYIPIFLFLLSCSSSTKDTTSIKLYLQAEPISFDPRIGGDRRSQVVLRHLFEGLTRIGAQGTAELALAKACSISSKGTIYTFSLQKTYWSNGLPVTAHDFEFAWKTVIDPSFGSAYSHVFAVIKNVAQSRAHKCSLNEIGIQAIDDYTLEVVLEHPCPYFLELIANPLFSPAYSAYVTKDWNSKTYPEYVSNGPYILKEHVVKSHILL